VSVKVNLLPKSYIQARRHARRFKACLVVATIFLSIELIIGLVFHVRADKTRNLYAAADSAKESIQSIKAEMVKPAQEAALLAQQVSLATRLRAKHPWSRLLGRIAQATPDEVVITTISTQPPRWAPNLKRIKVDPTNTNRKAVTTKLLEGMVFCGYAMTHQDIYHLITAIQKAAIFNDIDIKEMQRDEYLKQDMIKFELHCYW